MTTDPKARLAALGTSVPVAPEPELFGFEVEPTAPTQPDIERTARVATIKAKMPKDGRQLWVS